MHGRSNPLVSHLGRIRLEGAILNSSASCARLRCAYQRHRQLKTHTAGVGVSGCFYWEKSGAPGTIRTSDPQIRSMAEGCANSVSYAELAVTIKAGLRLRLLGVTDRIKALARCLLGNTSGRWPVARKADLAPLPVSQCLDEQRERGRGMAPARIVEVIPGERGTPVLQHPHQFP